MSAELIRAENSSDHGVRGVIATTGMTAERRWLVRLSDTDDYLEALTVVPQPPSPWSVSFPTLRLRSIEVEEIIGAVGLANADSHTYAHVRVKGSYATPDAVSYGGAIPPEDAVPGNAFSQWEFGETSRKVATDAAGAALINKDGADVLDAGLEIRVVAYRTNPPALSVLLPLIRPIKLNSNAITFPALWGGSATFIANPGQALFLPPRTQIERSGVVRMEYRFLVANDWKERAQKVDANGNTAGPVVAQDIYTQVNIPTASLWGA